MFNFHSVLEFIYITVNSQGFDDRKFGRKGGPTLGGAAKGDYQSQRERFRSS